MKKIVAVLLTLVLLCPLAAFAETVVTSFYPVWLMALNLTEGSRYTGAINPDGAAGSVSVTIDESSTWTLTADSFVDSLDAAEGSIDLNGYTLTVNGEVWNG